MSKNQVSLTVHSCESASVCCQRPVLWKDLLASLTAAATDSTADPLDHAAKQETHKHTATYLSG